jgi:hypothetical protein
MESLAKHFRELTTAAFTRYGFAYAELLTQWPAIVGDDLARLCEPERIRWPRNSVEKQGGTLILRAAPGRALDLQHEVSRIAERINGFYGYTAVGAIKIVQAPLKAKPAATLKPELDPKRVAALEARLQTIADPTLRAALEKLGRGALASRPQEK